MPQTENDSRPHDLEASDYVLHLWRRRFWILGLTAAAFILCYLGIRAFMANQFEARALVMVRQQPRITNIETDRPGIHPPSFRSLFTSDEVIEYVRRQYNDMVANGILTEADGHHKIETPIEKLRGWFLAQSGTTVDTTISTEFSPVIELRTKGTSQGQAKSLMEIWISRCLEKYGNLLNEEARFLADSAQTRAAELNQEMAELTARRERVERELQFVDAETASRMRQLTGAPLPERKEPLSDEVAALGVFSGGRDSTVAIVAPDATPGLWERRTQLEIDEAVAPPTDSPDGGPAGRASAELQKIAEIENRMREELRDLSDQAALLAAERAEIAVQLKRVEYAARMNASVAGQSEALVRATSAEGEGWGQEKYGTLRVLGEPVLPALRVWPKRTLIAGAAAIAMLGFLLLLFCAEKYLESAIRRAAAREGIA